MLGPSGCCASAATTSITIGRSTPGTAHGYIFGVQLPLEGLRLLRARARTTWLAGGSPAAERAHDGDRRTSMVQLLRQLPYWHRGPGQGLSARLLPWPVVSGRSTKGASLRAALEHLAWRGLLTTRRRRCAFAALTSDPFTIPPPGSSRLVAHEIASAGALSRMLRTCRQVVRTTLDVVRSGTRGRRGSRCLLGRAPRIGAAFRLRGDPLRAAEYHDIFPRRDACGDDRPRRRARRPERVAARPG